MFITKKEYIKEINILESGHWNKKINQRWNYHKAAIDILHQNNVTKQTKVLEIGTMGIKIFKDSVTMDYTEKWDFKGKNPNIVHDIRNTPWPCKDKEFDWVIALRVFQHIPSKQKECFQELKRVSNNAIIVVPSNYKLHNGKGIPLQKFTEMNNGIKPDIVKEVSFGPLYAWFNIA